MVNILSAAGTAGVSLLADWVRGQPPRVTSQPGEGPGGGWGITPAPLAHYPDDDGCPMCQVHADIAEAERLLSGMLVKSQPDGSIPPHFAATVVLADQRLRAAQVGLERVAAARPDLAEPARQLQEKVASAAGKLPARKGITRVTAQAAQVIVEDAWRDAVDLADGYFSSPEGPVGNEPGPRLRALVTSLSPAERAALARVLAEEPEPGRP